MPVEFASNALAGARFTPVSLSPEYSDSSHRPQQSLPALSALAPAGAQTVLWTYTPCHQVELTFQHHSTHKSLHKLLIGPVSIHGSILEVSIYCSIHQVNALGPAFMCEFVRELAIKSWEATVLVKKCMS